MTWCRARRIGGKEGAGAEAAETPDGRTWVDVPDLAAAKDVFMETGRFPSEQGIAWADGLGLSAAVPADLARLDETLAAMANG